MSGDNRWLDSAPTKGDASAFLPGGGIDVQTDQVKVFSTQATGESKDFMTSSNDGVNSLLGEANQIGATFYEAEAFVLDHGASIEALMRFNVDASTGIRALGQGAQTIAINYINADTTSAATMQDVHNAFDAAPAPGPTTPNGSSSPGGPYGNGTLSPTPGGNLPTANAANNTPYDPNAAKTISEGDASYTIPADAPGDLERLNMDDIRDTEGKFRDDLAKTGG